MSNIEFRRDHTGRLNMFVGDQYAAAARVTGMQDVNGESAFIVVVPVSEVTLGEANNVIPFRRRG